MQQVRRSADFQHIVLRLKRRWSAGVLPDAGQNVDRASFGLSKRDLSGPLTPPNPFS